MREIKFRVWDEKRKDMVSWKELVAAKEELVFSWISMQDENTKNIIEQFTGLHDKNGKEIYEGDIVKVLEVFHDKEKEYITDIIFEESAFLCKSDSSHYYDTFINSWHNPTKRYPLIEFEIIGNIHENPELIK